MTKKPGNKSFWETAPGLLTGLAAIITAIGGCIAVVSANSKVADIVFPPTAMPTPVPALIDSMDNLSNWTEYTDTLGSTIHISVTSATSRSALGIEFNLKDYGYVGIAKDINPDRLAEAKGIQFSYQGSGAPNTIELKLIYASGTVFSVAWQSVTATQPWKTLEALFGDFKCWPDTGPQAIGDPDHCSPDKALRLSLNKVVRLDFAISNKPERGGRPGSGNVVLDNVQGIR
jgi:hypothetical protein